MAEAIVAPDIGADVVVEVVERPGTNGAATPPLWATAEVVALVVLGLAKSEGSAGAAWATAVLSAVAAEAVLCHGIFGIVLQPTELTPARAIKTKPAILIFRKKSCLMIRKFMMLN